MFNEKKNGLNFTHILNFISAEQKLIFVTFLLGADSYTYVRVSEWDGHMQKSNLNHKTANIAERWRKSFKFLPLLSFYSLQFKTRSYSAAAVRIIFNFKKLSRFNRYIYIFLCCLLACSVNKSFACDFSLPFPFLPALEMWILHYFLLEKFKSFIFQHTCPEICFFTSDIEMFFNWHIAMHAAYHWIKIECHVHF